MEFHVLNTPICDIPVSLHCSQHSSRRESVMHRRTSFTHSSRSGAHSSASVSSATTPKFGKVSVSHTTSVTSSTGGASGKKYFSEPGTPVRPESPAVHTPGQQGIPGREELKLINEIASSFSKNSSIPTYNNYRTSGDQSPGDSTNTSSMKRASSTDSKRGSPHPMPGSGSRRESPSMRREGSFTKKESPGIQRKLSGRWDSFIPFYWITQLLLLQYLLIKWGQ